MFLLMSDSPTPTQRHVIAALVTNEPDVLAQVAGMFAARGFNIDSLVVGRTENPELSRMTIVVNGDDATLEQVRKQLAKLVPVVKVVDYQHMAYVERDLILVTVSTTGGLPTGGGETAEAAPGIDAVNARRSALIELAEIFRAKIVDVSPGQVMLELAGTEEKLEAFIQLVQPYGIIELARTGVIAMPRGQAVGDRRARVSASSASTIDEGDLPPG
jgi:acetolactate synthase-1/3 small subunit